MILYGVAKFHQRKGNNYWQSTASCCTECCHNDTYSCMNSAVKLYVHSHNQNLINKIKISTREKLNVHGVTVLKITTHSDTMQNEAFFPYKN
jgi:hypothetical protein